MVKIHHFPKPEPKEKPSIEEVLKKHRKKPLRSRPAIRFLALLLAGFLVGCLVPLLRALL